MIGFYDTDISKITRCFEDSENIKYHTDNHSLGFRLDTRKIKAKSISPIKINYKNEPGIISVISSHIKNTPSVLKALNVNNIKPFLKRIESSLYENDNIKINMIKSFSHSERKNGDLYKMMAFLCSGVLQIGSLENSKYIQAKSGNIVRKNRILLLTASQMKSSLFKKTGKYCGLYAGKPAITRFCLKALNDVSKYIDVPNNDQGIKSVIKAYGIKKPKLIVSSNILKEDKTFVINMSDQEIADAFENGEIDSEYIKKTISGSRINRINNIIKSKVRTI